MATETLKIDTDVKTAQNEPATGADEAFVDSLPATDGQVSLLGLFQDERPLTLEDEADAALAEMQSDIAMHLVSPVLRLVADSGRIPVIAAALLPHLTRCAWCRSMVRQMLQLMDAPDDHEAYALLQDADEGARWDAAGRIAAEAACRKLLDQGIGYVYEREGIVYRRLPDGTEERLSAIIECDAT